MTIRIVSHDLYDPKNNAAEINGGTPVNDLVWEIRREHRIEMMFDKDYRYWSLIRWRELERLDTRKYQDQTKEAWVADTWPLDDALTIDADGYIECKNAYEREYDAKHYLAPIPNDQRTLTPEIGQNPGW